MLTVLPGSWTEALAPAWDLVTGACAQLPERQLVWLAGADYDALQTKGPAAGVTVIHEDWTIERLMVASDLVITKGSRTTLAELTALGVRSLSLSYGINPADDRRAPHYPGNRMLPAAELTAASLSDAIAEALAGAGLPVVADEGECAAQRIARRLLASVPERLASSLE